MQHQLITSPIIRVLRQQEVLYPYCAACYKRLIPTERLSSTSKVNNDKTWTPNPKILSGAPFKIPETRTCVSDKEATFQNLNGPLKCPRCQAIYDKHNVVYRYRICVIIPIGTYLQRVSVFGESINQIFGCTASEFHKNYKSHLAFESAWDLKSKVFNALDNIIVGEIFTFTFPAVSLNRVTPLIQMMSPVSGFTKDYNNLLGIMANSMTAITQLRTSVIEWLTIRQNQFNAEIGDDDDWWLEGLKGQRIITRPTDEGSLQGGGSGRSTPQSKLEITSPVVLNYDDQDTDPSTLSYKDGITEIDPSVSNVSRGADDAPRVLEIEQNTDVNGTLENVNSFPSALSCEVKRSLAPRTQKKIHNIAQSQSDDFSLLEKSFSYCRIDDSTPRKKNSAIIDKCDLSPLKSPFASSRHINAEQKLYSPPSTTFPIPPMPPTPQLVDGTICDPDYVNNTKKWEAALDELLDSIDFNGDCSITQDEHDTRLSNSKIAEENGPCELIQILVDLSIE